MKTKFKIEDIRTFYEHSEELYNEGFRASKVKENTLYSFLTGEDLEVDQVTFFFVNCFSQKGIERHDH